MMAEAGSGTNASSQGRGSRRSAEGWGEVARNLKHDLQSLLENFNVGGAVRLVRGCPGSPPASQDSPGCTGRPDIVAAP